VSKLPRAILFDLDDTLISAYRDAEPVWRAVLAAHSTRLSGLQPVEISRALMAYAAEFWSDPERHRYWRLRLYESRRQIVRAVFAQLSERGPELSDQLAVSIADGFSQAREEQMFLFDGAHETLDALAAAGVALALVTNGPAELQRGKVTRFDLARRFRHVQIEGEHGFGKPDPRAYRHAMQALRVGAAETWMVGDNLEWEVAAPQRLGIYAVWRDPDGRGLPSDSAVRPDRIIRSVRELLDPPSDSQTSD